MKRTTAVVLGAVLIMNFMMGCAALDGLTGLSDKDGDGIYESDPNGGVIGGISGLLGGMPGILGIIGTALGGGVAAYQSFRKKQILKGSQLIALGAAKTLDRIASEKDLEKAVEAEGNGDKKARELALKLLEEALKSKSSEDPS